MEYEYNYKYYDGEILKKLRPRENAIHTFIMSDGVIVAMFQGKRGERPDLDYVIRILRPGLAERPEAPPHTYWVVDLMIKAEEYKDDVRDIVQYYLDFYDGIKPFETIEERANYQLITVDSIQNKYSHLNKYNTLSVDYIATILELFSICEKRNSGAYMFRNLLQLVLDYVDGKADYMHLIKASQPINRRRG